MPLERHFLIRGQSEFLELLILMSDFCENVVTISWQVSQCVNNSRSNPELEPFNARWSKDKIAKLSNLSRRDIKYAKDPLDISEGEKVDLNSVTVNNAVCLEPKWDYARKVSGGTGTMGNHPSFDISANSDNITTSDMITSSDTLLKAPKQDYTRKASGGLIIKGNLVNSPNVDISASYGNITNPGTFTLPDILTHSDNITTFDTIPNSDTLTSPDDTIAGAPRVGKIDNCQGPISITSAMKVAKNDKEEGCAVCGDTFDINGSVMCQNCCRIFYKYSVRENISQSKYECQKDEKCPVTLGTRLDCISCTLRKCQMFGCTIKWAKNRIESPKMHKCEKCEYKTRKLAHMRMHFAGVHSGTKDLICEICGRAFALKSQLKIHIKVVHLKKKEHQCDQCDYAGTLPINLRDHIKAVHDKIQDYLCPVCGKTFSFRHNMTTHFKKMHYEDFLTTFNKDDVATKDFPIPKNVEEEPSEQESPKLETIKEVLQGCEKEPNAEEEIGSDKGENYLGGNYDETQDSESEMLELFEDVTEDFEEKDILGHNVKEEVGNDKEALGDNPDEVQKEIKSTKSNKSFKALNIKCDKCEYKALTTDTLKIHLAAKHNGPKDFVCNICGYAAAIKYVLDQHVKNVHPIKIVHLCEQCGYEGKTQKDLRDHTRTTHKLHNVHKCEKCNYTTKKLGHMRMHFTAVHSKTKDFVCDMCGRAFALKSQLNIHTKVVHFKMKDHRCDQCDYAGRMPRDLKDHIKAVHDKIQDYACPVCQKNFSFKHNMKTHFKKMHYEKNLATGDA